MKIHTPGELNDRLSEALAWRKREIAAFHQQFTASKREHERAALRRAGVSLFYAHWEGFTKEAARSYLELIARQRVGIQELRTCFVALACRKAIKEAAISMKPAIRVQLVDLILSNQGDTARFTDADAINTRSNLNTETLLDILATLGLSADPDLTAKELLIDGSLVRGRHAIAHGEREEVDEATYSELRRLVLFLLDYIKTKIENAAVTRAYLRK